MKVEISNNGLNILKSDEGFRKVAYPDLNSASGWCICFGNHYHPNGRKVRSGERVNFDKDSVEANEYIKSHLKNNVYHHFSKISKNLNQNQIDALCMLIYAVGNLPTEIAKIINEENSNESKLKASWRSHNFNGTKSIDDRRIKEYNLFKGVQPPVENKKAKERKISNVFNNINMHFVYGLKDEKIRNIFLALINLINQRGYLVHLTSGYRTYEEQRQLHAKDSRNAKPGNSRHEKGRAIDLNLISIKTRKQYTKKGSTLAEWNSTGIPQIAKELGFLWGGDKFRGYYDPVHFEIPDGGLNITKFNLSNLKKEINAKTTKLTTDSERNSGELTNDIARGDEPIANEKTKPIPPPEYITIRDSNTENNTLQKIIDFYGLQMKPKEILDYELYDNKTSIYSSYNNEQKKFYGKADKDFIVPNTILAIPRNKYYAEKNSGVNSKIVENNDYNSFIEKKISSIIKNKDYKKLNIDSWNDLNKGSIFKKESWCKVWVWSKSMDSDGSTLTNITNFVENIQINVNKNGGNFSITLPHISVGKRDIKTLADLLVYEYEFNGQKNYVNKDTLHYKDVLKPEDIKAKFGDSDGKVEGEQFIRKFNFFNRLLQNNDIVFIRMEKIGIDKKTIDLENEFKISNSSLPNNYFDMIGLVSNVADATNSEGGVRKINVSGQDLSKLLIDDGVYFFPIEYIIKDREQIILNSANHKSGNRIIIPPSKDTNKDSYEANIQNNLQGFMPTASFNFDKTQSIEEWLVFIFTQLTNIDIVHDTLFNYFEEKTFVVSREAFINGNDIDLIKASGIWQIVKLVIDKEIGGRRLADQSFASATGSLMNLIRKICQEPFVEFFMDTYGDKFYFICRKPPFSESSYKSNYTINIYEDDVIADNLSFNNEFYTWYKLNPYGSLIDDSLGESMAILPAVMLPEYMEIWGSKILEITTQYLDIDVSQSVQTENNLDIIKSQGRQDLDWLIETHAYLPFTRQGTITIKSDRRIKRGMNIRYVPTGELFYVDGVSNSREFGEIISSETTLQVNRGIVEKHYEKYFNLVKLLRNNKNSDKWDPTTWSVNTEIFKFLLNRRQI